MPVRALLAFALTAGSTPTTVRRQGERRPSRAVDHVARPQRALGLLEDVAHQLLAPEPGAFVFRDDEKHYPGECPLGAEAWRELGPELSAMWAMRALPVKYSAFPGTGPRQHRPDEPAATAQEELTAVWGEVAA